MGGTYVSSMPGAAAVDAAVDAAVAAAADVAAVGAAAVEVVVVSLLYEIKQHCNLRGRSEAQFLVPDRRGKVDYGIGLSYWPAGLHILAGGTTTLSHSRLNLPVRD
jgi:hypothetical protein